jgi:hypothetical protein
MKASAAGFTADGANFDGTNDYMSKTSALTGAADAYTGAFSCWIKKGASSFQEILDLGVSGGSTYFQIRLTNTNVVFFRAYNSGATASFDWTSSDTVGTSWSHLALSWNMNFSAGNKVLNAFLNGAAMTEASRTDANAAFQIGYNQALCRIGADTTASNKLTADLADVWFMQGGSVDFTNSATLQKFRTAGGKMVNLGTDGSTPTGSAPIAFFHIDLGAAASGFATNRGTGGNLTVTGALTTSATPPPYV